METLEIQHWCHLHSRAMVLHRRKRHPLHPLKRPRDALSKGRREVLTVDTPRSVGVDPLRIRSWAADEWFLLGVIIYTVHIHAYIHTYIHTYILTYLHTYILTYLHTYVLTYLRTYVLTYIHTYITLHYITLHYITLHYITLHYITLHYITLHYITLHYITYIHTYIHIWTYVFLYTDILWYHNIVHEITFFLYLRAAAPAADPGKESGIAGETGKLCDEKLWQMHYHMQDHARRAMCVTGAAFGSIAVRCWLHDETVELEAYSEPNNTSMCIWAKRHKTKLPKTPPNFMPKMM